MVPQSGSALRRLALRSCQDDARRYSTSAVFAREKLQLAIIICIITACFSSIIHDTHTRGLILRL